MYAKLSESELDSSKKKWEATCNVHKTAPARSLGLDTRDYRLFSKQNLHRAAVGLKLLFNQFSCLLKRRFALGTSRLPNLHKGPESGQNYIRQDYMTRRHHSCQFYNLFVKVSEVVHSKNHS